MHKGKHALRSELGKPVKMTKRRFYWPAISIFFFKIVFRLRGGISSAYVGGASKIPEKG